MWDQDRGREQLQLPLGAVFRGMKASSRRVGHEHDQATLCVCISHSIVSGCLRPHGLSMEFSRQEYWSGLPLPFPGDLPDLGIVLGSPALQADSLLSETPGKSSTF